MSLINTGTEVSLQLASYLVSGDIRIEKEVRWLQEQLTVSAEEEGTRVHVEGLGVNAPGPGSRETQVGCVKDVSYEN